MSITSSKEVLGSCQAGSHHNSELVTSAKRAMLQADDRVRQVDHLQSLTAPPQRSTVHDFYSNGVECGGRLHARRSQGVQVTPPLRERTQPFVSNPVVAMPSTATLTISFCTLDAQSVVWVVPRRGNFPRLAMPCNF